MPFAFTRAASAATAGACALGLLLAPAAVAATATSTTAAKAAATPHTAIGAIRPYDHALLVDANSARVADRRHTYRMNAKLRGIALKWAKHLGSANALSHNPNLVRDVSKVCPNWTTIGENVGYSTGPDAGQLFSAYMHSPEHRANILDSHYTVVGIETATVVRNGVAVHWNVMDFANHCGS